MKKLLTFAITSLLSISAFANGVDTTALEIKIYKFAVSTSPDCSNLTTVITNSNPSYQDFKGAPDLGSGNLADGTYPCVAIEFSDQIQVTYAGTPAVCTSNTFIQDVCLNCTTSTPIGGGAKVNCANSQDDRVVMYISTAKDSLSENWNPFNPPACNTADCGTQNTDAGIHLGTSLSVSGSVIGKFTVGTDGKVCDGNTGGNCAGVTGCEMKVPNFSFSQI
jgi:hypothetical protein